MNTYVKKLGYEATSSAVQVVIPLLPCSENSTQMVF